MSSNLLTEIKNKLSLANKTVSLPILLAIFLLALFCLLSSGDTFHIEFRQSILFPIFLSLFYFLPRAKQRRLPKAVAIVVFVAGTSSSLEARGYLPLLTTVRGAILLQLTDKNGENATRERYRSYNKLAKQYDFPALHMVHQEVGPALSEQRLLARQNKAVALLAGDALWPEVIFHSDVSYYNAPSDYSQLTEQELATLKDLALDPASEFSIVKSKLLRTSFALQVVPESFKLPSAKIEISDRLLGWLFRGLADSFSPEVVSGGGLDHNLLEQQDSFLSASRVIGQWPSGGAKAVAGLFLADSYLREAISKDISESAVTDCALEEYGLAAGLTSARAEPHSYASIFNNAAVAMVLTATSREDFTKAAKWFGRAVRVVDSQGRPVRAAKLAMFNLIQLQRTGAVQ